MRNIIFISLLIITLSKVSEIEFNKEIPFDKNNNEFELTFPEDGSLYISVTFKISDLLVLKWSTKGKVVTNNVKSPGLGIVGAFSKGDSNKIILEYKSDSNATGIIWMNPSTNEIKVDLKQTYQWKYGFTYLSTNIFGEGVEKNPLTYSIDKTEKDTILEFRYDERHTILYKYAENPLKVCHGETCKNEITNYEIKKGESYKIHIKVNKIRINYKKIFEYYYLPSFSFNFIGEEEKKEEKKEEEKEE